MEETIKHQGFSSSVAAAMKRASEKVRQRAKADNRPIVFWKEGRVVREVPRGNDSNK
jgi:hypothetical protein